MNDKTLGIVPYTETGKAQSLFFENIVFLNHQDIWRQGYDLSSYAYDYHKLTGDDPYVEFSEDLKKIITGYMIDKESSPKNKREKFDNSLMLSANNKLKDMGFRSIPFFSSLETYLEPKSNDTSRYFEVEISNLQLIDFDSLSFDHILEIRNDKNFCKKLRKLRAFYYSEVSGKEQNEAYDIILDRVDDLERSINAWGIKTIQSSIKQLLDSNTILGNTALVTASILSGNPVLITSATVAATSIEVGKIAIHFSERLLEKQSLINNDPASILLRAIKA